ncbi:MAG: exo-beta-N-acetylmuramidase NamZ family protein [Lacinutrix venerupis]
MSVQLMWCKNTVLLFLFLGISCGKTNKFETISEKLDVKNENSLSEKDNLESLKPIIVGANQTEAYLNLLKNKNIGIVANQTSVVFKEHTASTFKNKKNTHLVDSLLSLNVNIKKVFAPEHGFRGQADAGEVVKDGFDTKTGLPIVSLYGSNKKPSPEQLKGLDVVVFDIQDVGARFYTYISSLHYVMEACAEANIPVIILDRPNPNGHYIDGPILEKEHKSFIGMHPIPVIHGMTIGEYAQMINGENWLNNNIKCELTVITMKNYNHKLTYSLPIKPSPNLPNDIAINLYPSLCFFEGTNISVGRGTELQFQIYGAPFLPKTDFSFTPQPNFGSKYPKHENKVCYGVNLTNSPKLNSLDLSYLINAYNATSDKSKFFLTNGFFTKLAGTKQLQNQIEAGESIENIKATWKDGLDKFKNIRSKYLLYN